MSDGSDGADHLPGQAQVAVDRVALDQAEHQAARLDGEIEQRARPLAAEALHQLRPRPCAGRG